MIALRPNCKSVTVTSIGSVRDSSSMKVLVNNLSLENVNKVCFMLTGSNGTKTVKVEGEYYIIHHA